MSSTSPRVGLIGLAVMGKNLALNIADHGFDIAVFNRTTGVMDDFIRENPSTPGRLVGCQTLKELVVAIAKPRVIIVLVKAGPAVDSIVEQLLAAGLEADDIVVDAGNSLWTDTIRRERDYAGKLKFFGSGRFSPAVKLVISVTRVNLPFATLMPWNQSNRRNR